MLNNEISPKRNEFVSTDDNSKWLMARSSKLGTHKFIHAYLSNGDELRIYALYTYIYVYVYEKKNWITFTIKMQWLYCGDLLLHFLFDSKSTLERKCRANQKIENELGKTEYSEKQSG